MYYVIGSIKQLERLSASFANYLPTQIWERLKERVETFEQCYGADRDLEADLGGYAVIFPSMTLVEQAEHRDILEKYHAKEDEYEYRDIISTKNGQKWTEELFILSADYGIVMFYPHMENEGGAFSD